MTPGKHLIVNADDFGLSPGVNRGIIQCHENGIVTSASLMVRQSAAGEAAHYTREHPRLSVGLHVDLGEWAMVNGTWTTIYEVVPINNSTAVSEEVDRQMEAFLDLLGRNPTHLDSHQHVHRTEPVHSILLRVATELSVVLRSEDVKVRHCGEFYGQSSKGRPYPEGISVENLLKILRGLGPGITELGCHPGEGADLDSMYREERAVECLTLCDARVRAVLREEGIELCSFANWPAHETC